MPIGYVTSYPYVFAYGYIYIIRGLSALLVSDNKGTTKASIPWDE